MATMGKQWMEEEEQKEGPRHYRNEVARGWNVSNFSAGPRMDRRILPILGLPHYDRHLPHRTEAPEDQYESTITFVCNDEDRQAGPMEARGDFKPTTKFLASLRQEQGRHNSFLPKNERMRQRPFDEALRAELQWVSQH